MNLPREAIELKRDALCPVCRSSAVSSVDFGDPAMLWEVPDVARFYCGSTFVFGADNGREEWAMRETCGRAATVAVELRNALRDLINAAEETHERSVRIAEVFDEQHDHEPQILKVRRLSLELLRRSIGDLWTARRAAIEKWKGKDLDTAAEPQEPEEPDDRAPCGVCGGPVDDAEFQDNAGRHAWCAMEASAAADAEGRRE